MLHTRKASFGRIALVGASQGPVRAADGTLGRPKSTEKGLRGSAGLLAVNGMPASRYWPLISAKLTLHNESRFAG
jgi:hypothetical protein